jgi:hypothetical protein
MDAKRTTLISSNIGRGCEHCGEFLGSVGENTDVSESVNHYVEKHGYKLLHVGAETTHGSDGKPWHTTIAILGHDNPPAIQPPAKVEILQIPEDMRTPRAGTSPSGTSIK